MRFACAAVLRSCFLFCAFLIGLPVWSAESEMRTLPDVAYGADPKQKMDVYLPANKDAPAILMVHGGAWIGGDKSNRGVVENKRAHWVPRGFAFISVNNRLVPNANPLEQARDVAKALAYAQQHAPEWGIDPNKFVLMGHSAGAHLVDLLNADPSIATSQGAKPWLGAVSLDSGAVDVVARMQYPHAGLINRAFGTDAKFWKSVSPAHRIKPASEAPMPFMLICSSLREWSDSQNEQFAAKLKATGRSATVLSLPLNHAQINDQLGLPGEYTDAVDSFIRSLIQ